MLKILPAALTALLLALCLCACSLPAPLSQLLPGSSESAAPDTDREQPSGEEAAPEEEDPERTAALEEKQSYTEDPSGFEPTPVQPGDYTPEEVEAATNAVLTLFQSDFPGCVLTRLEYDSDYSAAQRARWAEQFGTEAVLVLRSDFTAGEGDGSLEPGKEYKDWDWVLVRNDEGFWEVRSWGAQES